MTVQEHAAAMIALAVAAPGGPALQVLDGANPDNVAPPYVLIYFADSDPEDAESRALEGRSSRFVVLAYAHLVGQNAAATRVLGDRLRAAWLDVRPTVAGRQCMPIRREDGQPPQRDESTGTLVMDRVDVYRLDSVPA